MKIIQEHSLSLGVRITKVPL